ncbi:MAG: GNAT family N-acetyltransferase, partial [Thermomicrobiales bacterium]
VEQIVADKTRDYIFSNPVFGQFEQMVKTDNQFVSGPVLRHICSRDRFHPAAIPPGVAVDVLEGSDVQSLYAYPGFGEALSYVPDHPRRDSLAAIARRGSEVVAIAGASIDAPELWQIGVHVIDSERGSGIGRAVVSRLTEAIFNAGVVPYYSTATTNIASRNLAQSLGFWPAWTEIYITDLAN